MMEEESPNAGGAAVAAAAAPAAKKPEVTDLSSSDVQTKYREAATIANTVLSQVLAKLAPGVLVSDVCAFGDSAIEEAVSKVFKSKKDMEKGVAFPTCVSLNTTVAHYSPLKSESKTLAAGDAVKVDLGVHIDGYIALVAHTVVLGAGPGAPVGGAQGDVMAAAHAAAEVALRLIKPGNKNAEVTEAIEAIAAAYGVKPMAAVQCSQLKRFELDSGKGVPLKRDPAEGKYETATFEANEVYAVEIAFTSGEGKTRETEQRTTVFKRAPLIKTQLKTAASRKLLSEVNKRHPTLPFSLRGLGMEEKDVRAGVPECTKVGSLSTFPVLEEKEGSATAHFRFTVLLLPGGSFKATGMDLEPYVTTTKALPEALAAVRNSVAYVKPVKGAAVAAAAGGAEAMKE